MKNIYFDFNVPKRLSEDFVLLMIMHLKTIPALVAGAPDLGGPGGPRTP